MPVLASDIGGMAEKVKDGMNGFTFRAGDASHLAERLVELLNNPELLNVFKANLKHLQIPSVEQEVLAYEDIYYSI